LAGEFSPDGRALAFQSNLSGRPEVYVQPYPGPGERIQVSVDGGSTTAWHPRTGELFFMKPPTADAPGRLMAVDVRTNPGLKVGRPRVLFEFRSIINFGCSPARCYDIAPDGAHFIATRSRVPQSHAPVTQVQLVQNWLEELKARVPTK